MTTPRRTRVALWGNFGSGNLGNEATLQAMASNVRRFLPLADVSCICSAPEDTRRRHGLPADPISPVRGRADARDSTRPGRVTRKLLRGAIELDAWRRAFARARRMDLLVFTGTGMLADDGEGPLGLPYEIFKWSLAAKAAGTPHVLLSVGVERVDHAATRFFLNTAVRLARHCSFRDGDSLQAMRRLGCGQPAEVYPDLAFSLPQAVIPAPAAGQGRPRVAVGLYDTFERGRRGARDAEAYRSYLHTLCRFVLRLLGDGHDVRIVIGDVSYDLPVLEDFRALLGGRQLGLRGTLCDEPARSVEQLLDQLARVELLVATRFHNLLLGFLLGRPALAISHGPKDDALMSEMGLAAYCQRLEELDLERLHARFGDLAANAARLRPGILAKAAAYRRLLDEQYQRALAPLAAAPPGARGD